MRHVLRRPRPDIRPGRRSRREAPYQASRHQAQVAGQIRIL